MDKENIYDSIDPEGYEKRNKKNSTEEYIFEHWNPVIMEAISKYSKNSVVLDLGCGPGSYSFEMSKYAKQISAVDSSERMIKYAQKKYPKINFIFADATSVPLKDKSVDVVFSFGLFEYVENKKKLAMEISRLLKPGGIGVIMTPNRYSFPGFLHTILYAVIGKKRRYKRQSFREMLKLFKFCGFDLAYYKMDDGLFWISCKLERIFGKKIYLIFENYFRPFKRNPLSNGMFFVIKKLDY
jgi:ubiquinone/menaquinone biosynthesis C-methylase UbiE